MNHVQVLAFSKTPTLELFDVQHPDKGSSRWRELCPGGDCRM
jgi:hypothetical protein